MGDVRPAAQTPGPAATGTSTTAAISTRCSTSSVWPSRRRPRRARLGWCAGDRLGPPPPRRGPRHRLSGDPRRPGVVARRPNAPDPALFGPLRTGRTKTSVLAENVFVEKVLPAGTLRAADDRRDGRLSHSVPRAGGVAAADADVAARDPDRRRARRRPRDRHRQRRSGWRRRPSRSCSSTAIPGALLTGPLREQCRRWPEQARGDRARACTSCPRTRPGRSRRRSATGSPR